MFQMIFVLDLVGMFSGNDLNDGQDNDMKIRSYVKNTEQEAKLSNTNRIDSFAFIILQQI